MMSIAASYERWRNETTCVIVTHMLKRIYIFILLGIAIAGALVIFIKTEAHAPAGANTNKASTSKTAVTKPTFDKHMYSLTDPTSIWVIVNKQHPLSPLDYVPADLTVPNIPLRVPGNDSMQVRKVTAQALETMFAAAKTDGINLMLASGYRSYTYQVNLYNGYVQSEGQQVADTQSARPGFSEHQTGLAADLEPASRNCEVDQCFANTPEGEWLAANAYLYGFIIRYPNGLDNITGYEYEPWHVRYVGIALATEMHKENVLTLEQFFNVSGGTTYIK